MFLGGLGAGFRLICSRPPWDLIGLATAPQLAIVEPGRPIPAHPCSDFTQVSASWSLRPGPETPPAARRCVPSEPLPCRRPPHSTPQHGRLDVASSAGQPLGSSFSFLARKIVDVDASSFPSAEYDGKCPFCHDIPPGKRLALWPWLFPLRTLGLPPYNAVLISSSCYSWPLWRRVIHCQLRTRHCFVCQ